MAFPSPEDTARVFSLKQKRGDYLFDAGAPVMDILIDTQYDVSRLKAAFISHCHPDHFFGLVHMLDLSSWYYYKAMEYSVYMPEQRGIDMLKSFCGEIHKLSDKVYYKLIEEGTFFDDGNVRVTAVHTDHMKASTDISYGFLIEGEGKRVYITGDMHPSLEDFPEALLSEHTDILVTECAHFPAEVLLEKLKNVNADRIMVIHVHPSGRYDDLRAQNSGSSQLAIFYPNDGDTYTV